MADLVREEIAVENSRVTIQQHQSIVHVSVINRQRALRWHKGGIEEWSESDWYTALAGEAGECMQAVLVLGDTIKKRNRHRDSIESANNSTIANLREKLMMEIGDVYIYLDLLCWRAGVNLEDCVRATFNRISERENFPERL